MCGCGTQGHGLGNIGVRVGFYDLRGLFQPKLFLPGHIYSTAKWGWEKEEIFFLFSHQKSGERDS